MRIGLPLDGWDLAVVDAAGHEVPEGETGELIIGGVGLARYLDPAKDAEKYAAMPSLGWERAYRSGDLVVHDKAGLVFGGRADDQVKLGGRRIELGEIDSALLSVPGVVGAAAAVRRSGAGNQLLVGYVATDERFDPAQAKELLRHSLPAALVPRLAVVDQLPTRTSGKVDRDALPWPLPQATEAAPEALTGTMAWLAGLWLEVLGADVRSPADDFFDLGGGSLTAAQMVSRLRATFPEVVVGDIYEQPTVGTLAAYLDGHAQHRHGAGPDGPADAAQDPVRPGRRDDAGPRAGRPALAGLGRDRVAARSAGRSCPQLPWWLLGRRAGWCSSPRPAGCCWPRPAPGSCCARVEPGDHPRGGKVHLRLWLAQRVVDELGATGLAGAP